METALFWKTMLVVIYAKITVTSQFYSVNLRKLEIIFLLIWCKQKFGNFLASLIWAVETTETVLRYFHWIIFYIWTLSQKCKISYSVKTATCSHIFFSWLPSAMKQPLEKIYFEFLDAFKFSCTWNKEASFCRWNVVTFRHSIAYMVIFVFVLLARYSCNE